MLQVFYSTPPDPATHLYTNYLKAPYYPDGTDTLTGLHSADFVNTFGMFYFYSLDPFTHSD